MATKIFVYGTLLRGFGNWSWALQDQTFIKTGSTAPEYTMMALGSIPGVCGGGETSIQGEVFEVDDNRLREIDSLEGYRASNPSASLYNRREITLLDGTEVLIYIFNGNRHDVDGYPSVESGSWREHTGRYLPNHV